MLAAIAGLQDPQLSSRPSCFTRRFPGDRTMSLRRRSKRSMQSLSLHQKTGRLGAKRTWWKMRWQIAQLLAKCLTALLQLGHRGVGQIILNFSFNFHVQICNMADRLPRDGLLLNRVCGKKITASRMNLLAPRSNMSVGITLVRCLCLGFHGWFYFFDHCAVHQIFIVWF